MAYSTGASSLSATQIYAVATGTAYVFQVTSPTTSPFVVTLGTNQNVTVNAPSTVNQICFSTTLGTWQSSGTNTQTVAAAVGANTQTFVAGANAGIANVQIDGLDTTGAVISSANLILSLSASASSAASITLQPNVTAIAPSKGGTSSTATLTVMVRDVNNNPVGNAPVLFQLVNPTGGGEQISPTVVMTSSGTSGTAGQAQATFTAGTASTTQQSQIKASVIGAAGVQATTYLTVGGTAASIALGINDTLVSSSSDATFQMPITILVSDSN